MKKAITGNPPVDWWTTNCRELCWVLSMGFKPASELIRDDGIHPAASRNNILEPSLPPSWTGHSTGLAPPPQPTWSDSGTGGGAANTRTRTRSRGTDLCQKDADGRHTRNRKGKELRRNCQPGQCPGGGTCRAVPGRVHQCERCLKVRIGDSCGTTPPAAPAEKGSGKGKGKGANSKSKSKHFRGGAWR